MTAPADRRYLDSHEWHKLEGDMVTIGISRFAVDELSDITFVEIEVTDGPIKKAQAFGEIESVKATSELYSGIDGEVAAINQEVIDDPAIINKDPYGKGWLIKIKPADPTQLDDLLCAEDYAEKHGG